MTLTFKIKNCRPIFKLQYLRFYCIFFHEIKRVVFRILLWFHLNLKKNEILICLEAVCAGVKWSLNCWIFLKSLKTLLLMCLLPCKYETQINVLMHDIFRGVKNFRTLFRVNKYSLYLKLSFLKHAYNFHNEICYLPFLTITKFTKLDFVTQKIIFIAQTFFIS